MPDRSVVVALRAEVNDFVAGMDRAAASTRTFAATAGTAVKTAARDTQQSTTASTTALDAAARAAQRNADDQVSATQRTTTARQKSAEQIAAAAAKQEAAEEAALRRRTQVEMAAYAEDEARAKRATDAQAAAAAAAIKADRDQEASLRSRVQVELAAYAEDEARTKKAADERAANVKTVGQAALLLGGGVTAAVGAAVDDYMKFDKAMATVSADTHESAANMALLRTAAIDAGAATVYSATEAAQAEDELAKAGVSTADILGGGLAGALSLASAGGLEVSEAAETAATALVQFSLSGDQVGHVADLLAAGAGKAQGSVHDLGMALKQGGLVASQMGLSVEDTTGTLAAFASAGLVGSDAGTSLKQMLLQLQAPSKQSADLMNQLGINAYNAQGNFVGITDLAGQLQTKLGSLTQAQRDHALAQIFGSDAVRAANVLYRDGASGLQQWIDKTNDAGYAAETSAKKLDNLAGDWEYFTGDLDKVVLSSGSGVNDWLRSLVQGADGVATALGEVSPQALTAGTEVAAVGGATLVAGGAFLTFAPKVIDGVKALKALADSNSAAAGALGKAGKAAGVAGAAFVALEAVSAFQTRGKTPALDETTKALLDVSKGADGAGAHLDSMFAISGSGDGQINGLNDAMKRLTSEGFGADLYKSIDAVEGFGGIFDTDMGLASDSVGQVDKALANLVASGNTTQAVAAFSKIQDSAAAQGQDVSKLPGLFTEYEGALKSQADAAANAVPTGDSLARSITGVADQSSAAADAVSELKEGLNALKGQFFSVDEATDAYQSKLNDLSDAAKKNGHDLDGTSDKAIANREALRGAAEAAYDVIQKMAEQGASSDDLNAKSQSLKEAFDKQAKAAGYTGDQVDKVNASFDALPRLVQTNVVANGLDTIIGTLSTVTSQINALTVGDHTIHVTTRYENVGSPSGLQGSIVGGQRSGSVVARARGGEVWGAGTATSDSIDAKLSTGEFVVNAAATAANRGLLHAINDGDVRAYAAGGYVTAAAQAALPSAAAAAAMSPTAAAAAGSGAAQQPTGSYLLGVLSAGPDNAGAAADAYAAALSRQASAAAVAARAADQLDRVQKVNTITLKALTDRLSANEDAQKANGDAAVQAMQDQLDAVKDTQRDALEALKQQNSDAKDALKQRNADALDALKQQGSDEVDALRAKKAKQAVIDAASRANSAAEKALQRQQDDQEKAADRAADAAEKALAKQQDADDTAAENKITAAKKANAQASKDLADADAKAIDTAKARNAAAEAGASAKVTAAKDAEAAAAAALAAQEARLNQLRQDATRLAEQTAQALERNATLSTLAANTTAADLRTAAATLTDASAAADAAGRTVRGEDTAAARTRQLDTLTALATAATAYAAAQTKAGAADATVTAGLDQTKAKITDLGAAYGLTAAQIAKVTGALTTQRTSGADLLSNLQAEVAKTAELAQDVAALSAAGLNSTMLDQVISGGTGDGLALARTILAGGSTLLAGLNTGQGQLDSYSNALGANIASARYGAAILAPSAATYAGASTATLDPAAVALITQVATAIASRPVSVAVDGRQLLLAASDAAALANHGATA